MLENVTENAHGKLGLSGLGSNLLNFNYFGHRNFNVPEFKLLIKALIKEFANIT